MKAMRFKVFSVLSTWLLLGLLIAGMSAQATAQIEAPPVPPPPPPLGQGNVTYGPVFLSRMVHDEIGEGKTVKGAPLSAVLVVTRDTTLADGNRIHTENQTKIYRDSEGRVRREIGFDLLTPSTGAAKRNMIVIIDPVSGTRYMLNPQNKTAHQMPLHPRKGI